MATDASIVLMPLMGTTDALLGEYGCLVGGADAKLVAKLVGAVYTHTVCVCGRARVCLHACVCVRVCVNGFTSQVPM